ncbi:MAG: hypothetical protein AAFR35_04750 [Pseudomonadota bacterium]
MRSAPAYAALLAAGPVLAHEYDTPRMQLLIALIAENGCQMSDTEADETLPGYGFTRHETRQIIGDLLFDGRAFVDRASGTVRLTEEDCT